MTKPHLGQQDWDIRLHIYHVLSTTGHAPSYQDIADHFDIGHEVARQALHRLHDAHLLFLYPNTDEVMMAFPFSAVKTDYRVIVDGVTIYANCAWDSLGIPAMLKKDAQISISHPISRETVTVAVKDGELQTNGGVVHYARPFANWYDDLIDT